jgi:hypothetical protein
MQASMWLISPRWPLSSDSSAAERSGRLPSSVTSACASGLGFAGDELLARDVPDVVKIPQDGLQFTAELEPAVGQVRRGLE